MRNDNFLYLCCYALQLFLPAFRGPFKGSEMFFRLQDTMRGIPAIPKPCSPTNSSQILVGLCIVLRTLKNYIK